MARLPKEVSRAWEICDNLAAVLIGNSEFAELCEEEVVADNGYDQMRWERLCRLVDGKNKYARRLVKELRQLVALQMRFEEEDATQNG